VGTSDRHPTRTDWYGSNLIDLNERTRSSATCRFARLRVGSGDKRGCGDAPVRIVGVLSIRQADVCEDAELRFDQIEPGDFGGWPHGLDSELPQRKIVDLAQVVRNQEKPLSRMRLQYALRSVGRTSARAITRNRALLLMNNTQKRI